MQVAKHKVVSIAYTLRDDKGQVLDATRESEPLDYLHGVGNIIPGLEKALEGKGPGEDVSVHLPPEEAYGEWDAERTQEVPRSMFDGQPRLEEGMQFQARTPNGVEIITIVEIGDDSVKVDANHPLAGQSLDFDVKVVEVRDATADEVEAGRPQQG